MDARFTGFLRGLRAHVRKMTVAVTTLAALHFVQQSLQPQILNLQQLHTSLDEATNSAPPSAEEAFPDTRTEYALFVEDFISLLAALVPQLARLGLRLVSESASSVGQDEEQVFWQLWRCLVSACSAFAAAQRTLPNLWRLGEQPFNPSMFAAFHAVIAWLLGMSRSQGWRTMQRENGSQNRNQDMRVILMQPTKCLADLGYAHVEVVARFVRLLPPQLIPMACCIVSEQFSNIPCLVPLPQPAANLIPPPAATYTQYMPQQLAGATQTPETFLYLFTGMLNDLLTADMLTGSHLLCDSLTAPAVVHLFKAVLFQPQELPSTTPQLVEVSVQCLYVLLTATSTMSHDNSSNAVVLSNEESNSGATALPLHLSPVLSKEALQTDIRLLHALGLHMNAELAFMSLCYEMQIFVLKSWQKACKLHSAPTVTREVMLSSVVGLAQQCTTHSMRLMRSQRGAGMANQGLASQGLQNRRSVRQQNQQQTLQAVLRENVAKLMRAVMITCSDSDLFSPIAALTIVPGPALTALKKWSASLGWVTGMEALIRGQKTPFTELEAYEAVYAVLANVTQFQGGHDINILAAHLSLAATLRKLLCMMQLPINPSAVGEGGHTLNNPPDTLDPAWVLPLLCAIDKLSSLVSKGDKDVSDFDIGRAGCGSWGFSGLGYTWTPNTWTIKILGAEASLFRPVKPKMSEASDHLPQQAQQAQVQQGSATQAHAALPEPAALVGVSLDRSRVEASCAAVLRNSLVHQLQTNICLALMQACGRQASTSAHRHKPSWLREAVRIMGRIPFKTLRKLMTHVLQAPSETLTQSNYLRSCGEWYAVNHFSGRMTPGCCNMNCTNMEGASEAALHTQLCGGCRRARYCSVECQKVAWKAGQHSRMCGKSSDASRD